MSHLGGRDIGMKFMSVADIQVHHVRADHARFETRGTAADLALGAMSLSAVAIGVHRHALIGGLSP